MSDILFRADKLPVLQNTTFSTAYEARASDVGDVHLAIDSRTGIIHNKAFDAEKITYDENYDNEQAFSPSYRSHLLDVERIVRRHFNRLDILEIGCGKGSFLYQLKDAGFSIRGVDPAYTGSDPDVTKALFSADLGLVGDAIVLRHVLEHIPHPVDFLAQVAEANGKKGLVYIEVPCLEWILVNRAWFDIFYEHVNYFRVSDFRNMFGHILEVGHLFNNQYIYVVADLSTLRSRKAHLDRGFAEFEQLDVSRSNWKHMSSRKRAIWGAASKGVIFAKELIDYGIDIEMAIDINPAKQGRYLPGSGLYIASPKEALMHLPQGAEIIVMNSRYIEEIKGMGGSGFTYSTIEAKLQY